MLGPCRGHTAHTAHVRKRYGVLGCLERFEEPFGLENGEIGSGIALGGGNQYTAYQGVSKTFPMKKLQITLY